MNSPSISIWLTAPITDWMRWRAGYIYLGQVSSSAVATASDPDYKANGANAKWPMSHWYGRGDVQALYATLAPEKGFGKLVLVGEIGLMLYRPTWTMEVPDWRGCPEYSDGTCAPTSITVSHNPRLQLGATAGIGLRYGRATLMLSRWTAEASGDEWPAIYHGGATNLALRVGF